MAIHSAAITVDGPDGAFGAYLAAPGAGAGAPGVLVIQEIFGVNPHIRSVVDRFAEAGYAALAPDVFWRLQPGVELGYDTADVARGRELKGQMNNDQAVADLEATIATLAELPECSGGRPGVVGYCYGGLLSYLVAARLDPACLSSYYGGGIADYLHEAGKIDCPAQFHFGSEDTAIPLDQVGRLRDALADKPDCEVFVYEGAGHGFHCDQRGSYHAASADLAWRRTLQLFGTHLR